MENIAGAWLMGGLGKGLGALLSENGQQSVVNMPLQKQLREKQRELESLKDEIEIRKKAVNELRNDLTVKLLMEGKVDKNELFKKEEELKFCFDEKELLELEIEKLARSISASIEIPSLSGSFADSDGNHHDPVKAEIDLTMIREIIFDDDNDPQNNFPVDDVYGEALELKDHDQGHHPVSTAIEDEDEHIDDLKKELNGPLEARRIEEESYGTTEDRDGAPKPVKPVMKRRVLPRKVKLVRKVKKYRKKSRDRRYYSILKEAQYHLMNEDPGSAKKTLLLALRDYPMDGDLLYHLGNAYFLEGDLNSAEIRYKKSSEADPESFRALNNLGIVLKKKGDREAAIMAFNQALEINESYDRAWFNLGRIFIEIKPPMQNEARIFLRRALECNPNLEKAREMLDTISKKTSPGS